MLAKVEWGPLLGFATHAVPITVQMAAVAGLAATDGAATAASAAAQLAKAPSMRGPNPWLEKL